MYPLHLGALHPVEQALTFALAFGPFVVLGVVVAVRRRADAAAERAAAEEPAGVPGSEKPAGD
jgi:hypothetical protein